jgi:uncharacterized protein YqfB (UPF0267 family)
LKNVREYYDYYKYERYETKENCEILNSVTNVKWIPIEEYNAKRMKEDSRFKPVMLPRETNEHHISHYIRSLAENSNIIEQIKFVVDEDETLGIRKNRPIIDINATRILKAGLDPEILLPTNEAADRERNNKCRNAITGYENMINSLLTKTELDALKARIEQFEYDKKYMKTTDENGYQVTRKPQFTNIDLTIDDIKGRREENYRVAIDNENINEYLQRGEEDNPLDQDTLINMTDIIYYLNNNQLYDIGALLNDGVIIVGTAHVPKYLDTQEHLVQFGSKIEGKVIISPNKIDDSKVTYNSDECTLFMKMAGNQYPYIHKLNYMQYLRPDMATRIITDARMGTNGYNFLLKCVPIEKYDCGATYYIRFQIIKISDPTAKDIITEEFMGYEAGSYLNKMQRELDQHKPLYAIINEVYDLLINPEKTRQMTANATWTTVKISNIRHPALKETQLPMNKRIITREIPVQEEVFLQDGKYYFTRREKSTKENLIRVLRFKKNDLTDYIATIDKAVSPKLINKLTNKMVMMQNLDLTNIKSLISFIQKEDPSLNIPNQVIPLLAKVMQETLTTEQNIATIMESNLFTTLNQFKNGEYKLEKYEVTKETAFTKIKKFLTSLFYTPVKVQEVNMTSANKNF